MPAQKKDNTVRRRRNTAATRAVLTSVDPDADIPPLPQMTKYDAELDIWTVDPWSPQTEDWWNRIWLSPMSTQYDDADVHGLIRLMVLDSLFWKEPSAAAHSEIRLAQKDFGLTPYDRKRLEWQIEETDDKQAKGTRRRNQEAPKAVPTVDEGNDPRQHTA